MHVNRDVYIFLSARRKLKCLESEFTIRFVRHGSADSLQRIASGNSYITQLFIAVRRGHGIISAGRSLIYDRREDE